MMDKVRRGIDIDLRNKLRSQHGHIKILYEYLIDLCHKLKIDLDVFINTFFVMLGLKPAFLDDADMFYLHLIQTQDYISDDALVREIERVGGHDEYLKMYRRKQLLVLYRYLNPRYQAKIKLTELRGYYMIYNSGIDNQLLQQSETDEISMGILMGYVCPGKTGGAFNYEIWAVSDNDEFQLTTQQCDVDMNDIIYKYYSYYNLALILARSKYRISVKYELIDNIIEK